MRLSPNSRATGPKTPPKSIAPRSHGYSVRDKPVLFHPPANRPRWSVQTRFKIEQTRQQ